MPSFRTRATLLLLLLATACGKDAEGWEYVDTQPGGTLYLQRDSIVKAAEGVKVAWVRANLLATVTDLEKAPDYDRMETRSRFDCARKRVQALHRRRLRQGKLVSEGPVRADSAVEAASAQWSALFQAVCTDPA